MLCAVSMAALAQTSSPDARPARPDPLDPGAHVPALQYRPSLTPARGAESGKLLGWREANDTVARIGGWRTYAREAQAAPMPMPVPVPVPPADHVHGGHGGVKTP